MADFSQPAKAGYSFDQALEFAASTSDDYLSGWESLADADADWPCYEHADNFGDC